MHGSKDQDGSNLLKITETLTESMEPMEFEWTIFPGLIRCSSAKKSKVYCTDWEKHQKFSQEDLLLFMSMFNDISCGTRDDEQECLANARLVSLYARKFGKGQFVISLVQVLRKSGYSIKEDSPQGIWDNIAEKMLVEFAESGCPIFRATTTLS